MRCLILQCSREAESWFRIDESDGSYMTASCALCEGMALQSVMGPRGYAVTKISHDEFLVAEVMESMGVFRANMEVGNGRLLWVPFEEE